MSQYRPTISFSFFSQAPGIAQRGCGTSKAVSVSWIWKVALLHSLIGTWLHILKLDSFNTGMMPCSLLTPPSNTPAATMLDSRLDPIRDDQGAAAAAAARRVVWHEVAGVWDTFSMMPCLSSTPHGHVFHISIVHLSGACFDRKRCGRTILFMSLRSNTHTRVREMVSGKWLKNNDTWHLTVDHTHRSFWTLLVNSSSSKAIFNTKQKNISIFPLWQSQPTRGRTDQHEGPTNTV